jgi:hypothetical protein
MNSRVRLNCPASPRARDFVTESESTQSLRRPLDLRAATLTLILCVVWGFQQVAMKGVASHAAPVVQLAIRFGGPSMFFGLWVLIREGHRAFNDGTLPSGLLLGLMFSTEFIFVGQALVHTSAAHSVVFLYTAPIFTALGLQFLPEERLSRLQWTGIGVAFCGIVVAFFGFGGRSSRPAVELLAGDFLALLGGASWGFSNVVLRRGDRADPSRTDHDDDLVVNFPNASDRHLELPRVVLVVGPLPDLTSDAAVAADAAIRRVVRSRPAWRSHRSALRTGSSLSIRGRVDRQLATHLATLAHPSRAKRSRP